LGFTAGIISAVLQYQITNSKTYNYATLLKNKIV
jgi:hypothetical protein